MLLHLLCGRNWTFCTIGKLQCLHNHVTQYTGGYPSRDNFLDRDRMCFWKAASRHVVYIAGFFTMGAIALSIYLRQQWLGIQKPLSFCRCGWVYLGILGIWVISFLSTIGYILCLMRENHWNGTVHDCDAVYDGTKNCILPAINILNFAIMGKNLQDHGFTFVRVNIWSITRHSRIQPQPYLGACLVSGTTFEALEI